MKVVPVTSEMLERAAQPHRPKGIIEMRDAIDGEVRAAELVASVTGEIDQVRIQKIVQMKLELDGMYADLAQNGLLK